MASKVGPETPSSEHLGSLFGFLGRPWGHSGGLVAFQKPSETHSKKYRNFGDFRVPQGTTTVCRGPGSPGSKKRTFSAKPAFSLQRGANFAFLDFGTPLEKSVSLTFSEQWLCHFSKGFRCCVSGRSTRQWETTRQLRAQRHGGGYIYIYVDILLSRCSAYRKNTFWELVPVKMNTGTWN